MKLKLDTSIIDIHLNDIANLSLAMSRKLAVALAGVAAKTKPDVVTVEDLLNYFPMRYEDRSNFLTLDKLEEGMRRRSRSTSVPPKVSASARIVARDSRRFLSSK